jgi:hypothetical protein
MINNLNSITSSFFYVSYIDYPYTFGDLDLFWSGGVFGKSPMTFGLFYDDIVVDDSARLIFSSEINNSSNNKNE